MLYDYFSNFNKKLVKKAAAPKTAAKKGTAKTKSKAKSKNPSKGSKTAAIKVDMKLLKDRLSNIVPSKLIVESYGAIDSSGFSPDGIDFIAYDPFCPDIDKIMNGSIPSELIYGTFHVIPNLNKDTLIEAMGKVMAAKKLDRFTEMTDEQPNMPIPAFLIAMESDYDFAHLKNDIINFYMSRNIDPICEMDILVIMDRGIVVKNWREQRSFIALETKDDSMMTFFILMNEYLDMNRNREIDFRKYAKKEVSYKEY